MSYPTPLVQFSTTRGANPLQAIVWIQGLSSMGKDRLENKYNLGKVYGALLPYPNLNKLRHAAFNESFNQNGAKMYLSKQEISRTIRHMEIVLRRNV